ncbi:hypothetical protein Taro_039139 [Colocasia esculenta]|uniref:Uncharacterized protein n=1 Tax=Colocasia esculenta TaxID=4460 RepID=A0A843W5I6_COLES|nr:hypothetical protein [Colocasia esculenta]
MDANHPPIGWGDITTHSPHPMGGWVCCKPPPWRDDDDFGIFRHRELRRRAVIELTLLFSGDLFHIPYHPGFGFLRHRLPFPLEIKPRESILDYL